MSYHSFSLIFILCVASAFTANITVTIIGTNDIHGAAFPTLLERSDTG